MVKKDNSTPRLSSYDIERQIRIERNLAISAFLRDVVRALARRLHSFALWSIGLVRRLAAEGRRRRAIHHLQRFDDRTLEKLFMKPFVQFAWELARNWSALFKLDSRPPARWRHGPGVMVGASWSWRHGFSSAAGRG